MTITTTENDIKERLSVAYVTAVAARAGCQIAKLDIDKQSIDAIVRPISGLKSQVNFQLKSTTERLASAENLRVRLPIKNYDDLRDTSLNIPHYLVVLQLPEKPADWLSMNESELAIRGVAYFGNLYGQPPAQNTTSRTVSMPQDQRFDVPILTRMILTAPERIGVAGG